MSPRASERGSPAVPRVCDLILVLLAAPLWLPLLALTAVLVAVVDGRPVFFTQPRAGRGGFKNQGL